MTKKKSEKIEELTEVQDLRLDEFASKWTKIGLTTEPIRHVDAEAAIRLSYSAVGLPQPKHIEWVRSPFELCIEGARLEWIEKKVDAGAKPEDAVAEAEKLFSADRTLSEEAQGLITDIRGSCCYGQQDAGWLGFLDYMDEVLELEEETKDADGLRKLATAGHWWLPFDNICLASERPIEMHLNTAGDLHRDGGPAMLYADGFSLFCLNGVHVPEEIVFTPSEKLSADLVLKEKNAEIRREIVRKIGAVRICKELGAETVDKWKEYELLLLDLKDGRKRPYLKMKNPSIDAVHIEGVHPDCKTVKDALAWRNGMKEFVEPKILT